MKTQRLGQTAIIFVYCILMSGCLTMRRPQPEDMLTPLPRLTTALQALVRWPPEGRAQMTNDELVAEVFKTRPELGQAFSDTPIKVWHDKRNVIVLVCSPDGKQAWLEDASWTPAVDCSWYKSRPAHPAEFTLIASTPVK